MADQFDKGRDGGRVSYLGRLLDLLDAVAAGGPAAAPTLGQAAARAGIPLSTASRLVQLLLDRGYVRRGPDQGLVPGVRLIQLGLRAVDGLRDTARLEAAVESLAEATGESVSAGVLVDDEILLIARVESAHPLRMVVRVGDVIEPHTSAMGKSILATLPTERRLAVLRAALGERAEAVLDELEPELETVQEDGYACDEQVYAVGLRCRAAAIRDHLGLARAAISVAGPAARFTREAAAAAIPALLAETSQLSLDAGVAL